MVPPATRPQSRFIRGRARGGGAYRPYFYFRRNGKTIPAGGKNQEGPTTSRGRGGRRRGWGSLAGYDTSGIDAAVAPGTDTSFLRPQHYAAPEVALQVQSIAVDSPLQCPGWRLYFPSDSYKSDSQIAKRIKALEQHYSSRPEHYDFAKIQSACYFNLHVKVVEADEKLMQVWPNLREDLRTFPLRTLATFGVAMHAAVTIAAIDSSLSQQSCNQSFYVTRSTRPHKIYVRPVGFFDVDRLSRLTNAVLDQIFCVRGSIVAVGTVNAAASWIAYKCTRCCQEQAFRQTGFYTSRPYACKRDECHAKKGFVEQRSSPYTRIAVVQIIRLAETQLPAAQTDYEIETSNADYVDIELRHDLVDAFAVGDEIIVTGVLKMRALVDDPTEVQQRGNILAKSQTKQMYLKAVSVSDATHVAPNFTARDLQAVAMINAEPDCFKLLVHSLAPEVHGQELVKAGVLLSLFGGAGSQIHDDEEISVLIVGDPGVGKTHILQMCTSISEKATFVNGKCGAASSSQLTTSVQGRTNYTIDCGALVNARNGHCAIDDVDRLASEQETLLQALQSQMICLPFAGIYTTLTMPSSIIAAANTTHGQYDQSKLLTENARINTALLSEFHLIFVLLDNPDKDMDASLTEHIRALHAGTKKSANIAARFSTKPKTNNSLNFSMQESNEVSLDENYDLRTRLKLNGLDAQELDLLPGIVMRKFVAYARQQVKPLLTREAAEFLKTFYMELRQERNDENTCAISTSQLQGLIRLTQARARIDFADEATVAHVRDVLCIMRQSLADTNLGAYNSDLLATTAMTPTTNSKRGSVKKFIEMLQQRSNALARRIFDFDELKDMAHRAGISSGVTNLVDVVNMQGFLLKKGPNLYEVLPD